MVADLTEGQASSDMPNYTVVEGDHLAKIAHQHGFSDFTTIWDHSQNAGLKKKRSNPNILFPGDTVFIPDHEIREESKPTEKRHRFVAKRKTLMLRLVLRDLEENAIQGAECELSVAGETFALTTDGQGQIEVVIPPTADDAKLKVKETTVLFPRDVAVKIGHQHPVDEVSGQERRLRNLGYMSGVPTTSPANADEEAERKSLLQSAIEEFQCDHGLTVDGKCGPNTQAKLKEVHGC